MILLELLHELRGFTEVCSRFVHTKCVCTLNGKYVPYQVVIKRGKACIFLKIHVLNTSWLSWTYNLKYTSIHSSHYGRKFLPKARCNMGMLRKFYRWYHWPCHFRPFSEENRKRPQFPCKNSYPATFTFAVICSSYIACSQPNYIFQEDKSTHTCRYYRYSAT